MGAVSRRHPVPAPGDDPGLTPDAAARALRRAVARRAHPDDLIPLDEVLAVGREIGVADEDVEAAVALERVGGDPPAAPGARDRLGGPAWAVTVRVGALRRQDLEGRLESWLRVGHCMHPVRRDGGGAEWVPDDGIVAAMRRQARAAIGAPALSGVRSVRYRLGEAGRAGAVRLEAETGSRQTTEVGAAVMVVTGIGAGIVVAAAASPLGLLLGPLGAAAGALLLAVRRHRMAAVQREIERLADAVVHGESPPRARDAIFPGGAQRRAGSMRTPPGG